MEFTFPYRRERSKLFGKIYRPVVPVDLRWEHGEWMNQKMYIDSGADISLIPLKLGDSLGFDMIYDDIKEMNVIGYSTIPVIIENVNIKLCDVEFKARVAWSMIEDVPSLLGRMDIFDKFEIIFMQKEKNVVLYSKD